MVVPGVALVLVTLADVPVDDVNDVLVAWVDAEVSIGATALLELEPVDGEDISEASCQYSVRIK